MASLPGARLQRLIWINSLYYKRELCALLTSHLSALDLMPSLTFFTLILCLLQCSILYKLSSVLMFDVYNNTAPHNILHLFIPTQQIHSYSTRSSSSGNYYISHSRLNQKNGSFSIMGVKIWNSIPENLRNSSKSLFKERVHTILLKICLNCCLDFLTSISLVTDLFYFISFLF